MKFGKLPARNAMSFKFEGFVNRAALPVIPKTFHRQGLVPTWYGLGNDRFANCVWAGAAHETMLATTQQRGLKSRSRFTIFDVNSDYAAVTGFDPKKPETDVGTDMKAAASYRRTTGILDATGERHRIDSYQALRIGDPDQLAVAMWLTGAVGVGLKVTQSAMDQFDKGLPWTVVESSPVIGLHYVPTYDRLSNGNFLCVTFGQDQEMEPAFYHRYSDEAAAYITIDRLVNNISPEAFDLEKLRTMLAAL